MDLAVRHDPHLSVALSNTKIKWPVDSALLERNQVVTMKRGMPLSPSTVCNPTEDIHPLADNRPWNVRQAAEFLGVSPQTVYLWVERRQIPHLRVMGRNIRFLRSDLAGFRESFRHEPEHTCVV